MAITYDETIRSVTGYYDQQVALAEASGAGLIWFMGNDHLSPMMYNDDETALDPTNWRQGISRRVIAMANVMEIGPDDTVLELGCGIGGPGRDISSITGANVIGISLSGAQLHNLLGLSLNQNSTFNQVAVADMCVLPFRDSSIDAAYAVNSVYHAQRLDHVYQELGRIIKPGGVIGIDDWFKTDELNEDELAVLINDWSTGPDGFHGFDETVEQIDRNDFTVVAILDYTDEAGKFLSEERFGVTYDRLVAPILKAAFPDLYSYKEYVPEHADLAVQQLRSSILNMGAHYRSGKLVYRQIVARKGAANCE